MPLLGNVVRRNLVVISYVGRRSGKTFTGVTERGTWKVADAVAEQPWLSNGPIPLQVTWTRPATDPRFGAVA